MNKWLCAVLAILVAVLFIMCILSIDKKREEEAVQDTVSENNVSAAEDAPVEEEDQTLDTNVDVLVDYYDIHKSLFDYNVEDLTVAELTRCVNASFESESIPARITEDVVDEFILDIKSRADEGYVYLVTHALIRDDVAECRIDVCSFVDRVNPLFIITLTQSEDGWSVHKE